MNTVRTKVRQKALALETFTVADIVRATGFNPESVRTELQRMRQEGLLISRRDSEKTRRQGGQPALYQLTDNPEARLRLAESLEAFYSLPPAADRPTNDHYFEAQQLLNQAETVGIEQWAYLLPDAEFALEAAEETEGGSLAPVLVKAYLQFEHARLAYLHGRYEEAKGRLETLHSIFIDVDEQMVERIKRLQMTLSAVAPFQHIQEGAAEISEIIPPSASIARQLTMLNRIGRIITSSVDPKAVPSLILQEVSALLAVEGSSVLLVDDTTEDLVFIAATGAIAPMLYGQRLSPKAGLTGYVVASGEQVIVNDVQHDERFDPRFDEATGFRTRSLLIVPLRNTGGIRGVIEVVNRRDGSPFNEEDRELLEVAANQMVIALQHTWGSTQLVDIPALLEQPPRPVQLSYIHEGQDVERPFDLFDFDTEIPTRILVVDDEPNITSLMARYLKEFYVATAHNGREALEKVRAEPPDLIFLDVALPEIDGLTVCRLLKEDEQTALIPITIVTGLDDRDLRKRALEAGADDFLRKPFSQDILQVRVRSHLRLRQLYNQLRHTEEVIFTLAEIVETKDTATEGHQRRVSAYSEQLALACSLKGNEVRAVRYAAMLHDIGKIGVSEAILRKPGPLTAQEMAHVRLHPEIGARIVAQMRFGRDIARIIRAHHENWDGSGYPYELRGEAIPIGARILAIANAFDSMMTDRPFKAARRYEEAFWELDEKRGTQFDPKLLDIFHDLANKGQLVAFGKVTTAGGARIERGG